MFAGSARASARPRFMSKLLYYAPRTKCESLKAVHKHRSVTLLHCFNAHLFVLRFFLLTQLRSMFPIIVS